MDVNFSDLKVMIIDDSKTIRRTTETLLAKAGCTVVTAIDGFDALAGLVLEAEHDVVRRAAVEAALVELRLLRPDTLS